MKINTSELSGKALDWAVAKSQGVPVRLSKMASGGFTILHDAPLPFPFDPSSDWWLLGGIIEKTDIVIANHSSGDDDGKFWGSAHCYCSGTSQDTWAGVKVAACRAIVAAFIGDTVEVPDELIGRED